MLVSRYSVLGTRYSFLAARCWPNRGRFGPDKSTKGKHFLSGIRDIRCGDVSLPNKRGLRELIFLLKLYVLSALSGE